MVATTSPNRIAPYLNEPTKTLPPLPASAEGRSAVLSDAVFSALVALQGQLVHHDPKIVQTAAGLILNFEMTRLRHGRPIVGTAPGTLFTAISGSGQTAPAPGGRGEERKVSLANPLDTFIEKVRAELQRQEDAEGSGVIVSREQAEECARYIQVNMGRTPFPPTGRSVGLDSAPPRPDAIRDRPVPAAKECRPCPSPTRPLRPSPCPTSSPATASPARAAAGGRTAPR